MTTTSIARQNPPKSRGLTAAAVTLIAAPPLLVAGTLLTPATESDPLPYLQVLAEHPSRASAGGLLFIVGHLLLATALLAMVRLLPTTVLRLSGWTTAYGALIFSGLGFTRLFEVATATAVGPTAGAEVLEEFNGMPWVGLAILPGVAGMMLGGLVFVLALSRAGITPWWVVVTFVAGQVGVMTGGDGTPIGVAGSAMLALTFGYLGWNWLKTLTAASDAARP